MIVPGLSFGIACHLSWVGLAKAYDTHRVGAKAENHHMQALSEMPFCFKASLGILFPRVFTKYGRLPLKTVGISQLPTIFSQVALVFGAVAFDVRFIYCLNNDCAVKSPLLSVPIP